MPQYAVPIQDDVTSNWMTPSLDQTNMYDQIDQGIDNGTPNDSSYIQGIPNDFNFPYADNDVYASKLTTLTDPVASTGHILKYRLGAGGFFTNPTISVELASSSAGGNTIAGETRTFSPFGGPTPTTYTLTLSSAQANSISDYSSLYFRVSGVVGDPSDSLYVYEVEFQVPAAGGGGGGGEPPKLHPEAFLMFL